MKNIDIATVFWDIADLLEIKGENKFKVRAYRTAAQAVENLPKEIEVMLEEGEDLKGIPGVGEAIATKTAELVSTGKLAYYENLKADFPEGITKLLEIRGVGPKTAFKLSESGIRTIDELEKAIKDGQVAGLFRLGEKTSENILRQIQVLRNRDERVPIGEALPVVEEIVSALQLTTDVENLGAAGSLRRFRETVGDIDLMGTSNDPEHVINAFINLPIVKEVLAKGPTKATVVLRKRGLQVDLRMVEHDSFGSLLQYFTGSKQHNIILRQRAQKHGLKLSEYGITDVLTDKLEKFATEEDFYHRLGLQYIPPEIREGNQELDLAEQNAIPQLLQRTDIKGDLHIHSDWSDGQDSIKLMAEEARALGYQYIAITDHSAGRGVAHGLDGELLKQQTEEIVKLNKQMKDIRILSGTEVDIKADGSLDLPQEVLVNLDIVIAAIHSSMGQTREQVTKRVIGAIANPNVDIIAHPTCRILGEREPIDLDIEAVFKSAVQYNKALEINAMPDRLDLKDTYVQRAHELGVMLVLGTDSHSKAHLNFMTFGIGVARRGWCQPDHVLNTRPLKEVLKYLRKN
jgi:DNA polymerase (family X)